MLNGIQNSNGVGLLDLPANDVGAVEREGEKIRQARQAEYWGYVKSHANGARVDTAKVIAAMHQIGKPESEWKKDIEIQQLRIIDAALLAKIPAAEAELAATASEAAAEGARFQPLLDNHRGIIRKIQIRGDKARDLLVNGNNARDRLESTAPAHLRHKLQKLGAESAKLGPRFTHLTDEIRTKDGHAAHWKAKSKEDGISDLRRSEAARSAESYRLGAEDLRKELAGVEKELARITAESDQTMAAMLVA